MEELIAELDSSAERRPEWIEERAGSIVGRA
jgi:hypothetical protein